MKIYSTSSGSSLLSTSPLVFLTLPMPTLRLACPVSRIANLPINVLKTGTHSIITTTTIAKDLLRLSPASKSHLSTPNPPVNGTQPIARL